MSASRLDPSAMDGVSATLDTRFAGVALASGHSLAMKDPQGSITYAELDSEVDRVAAALTAAGVRPGQLVPLSVKSSIAAVTVILAILRVGAAYVPLDRKAPPARLRGVIDQCGASLVVVDDEALPPSAEGTADLSLFPGVYCRAWRSESTGMTADRSGTAYVMFTSGSTGRPKGVVLSHAAVLHYLDWAPAEYGINDGSGTPLFSSLAFDLSITSLFGPLLNGKTVEILDSELWVLDFLQRSKDFEGFSFLKATPSHLSMLCTALEQEGVTVPVPLLVVGGEPLYGDQVAYWRRTLRMSGLVNEYGPTEAAVGCCRYWVPADASAGLLPIGEPSPGTILEVDSPDAAGAATVRGELLIGGPQLADGYLSNRSATDQAFIKVMDGKDETRRYRTGDVVSVSSTPPNRFTLHGRIDSQVKLAGHRVELGEIIACVRARPEVGDAEAVVTRVRSADQLTLFVSGSGGTQAIDTAELTSHLAGMLPTYMVPQRIIVIERFPLNDRGKVDRSQLKEFLDD